MHAMWKGTIQVAKIQIPVKLYAATEDRELSLKQIHADCGGSISHLKHCKACDTKVEPERILKVYDLGGGNYVELTEEELQEITPEASKTMIVEQFVEETEIDRIRMKKHYYMGTDEVGAEAFRLFHASLSQSRKLGIGYVTLRSVQSLAAIWPTADGLVLSTMLYEDEIRAMNKAEAPLHPSARPVSDAHVFVFNQLIQAMTAKYEGARYANRYDAALKALIDRKITKLAPRPAAAEANPALQRNSGLEDLLSSLTTSLDAMKDGDAFARPDVDRMH